MWWALQLVPFGFSSPMMPGVCCSVSIPSWVSVMRSPQELSIMPSAEADFSHLHALPTARPGYPVPPVVEGWHKGNSLNYLIQWVMSKDGVTWDLIWGLGYSGSSLPSLLSLSSTNLLLGRIFSGLSGVGLAWVRTG